MSKLPDLCSAGGEHDYDLDYMGPFGSGTSCMKCLQSFTHVKGIACEVLNCTTTHPGRIKKDGTEVLSHCPCGRFKWPYHYHIFYVIGPDGKLDYSKQAGFYEDGTKIPANQQGVERIARYGDGRKNIPRD